MRGKIRNYFVAVPYSGRMINGVQKAYGIFAVLFG